MVELAPDSPARGALFWVLLGAVLALTAAVPQAQQAPAPERTVLVKAAQVIDGRGGPSLRNGGVLIRGE
ncbi:MAG TPA: hypothetical protein VMW48_09485, partial [Vicinamibacterales bacterium]|nr:hypothetical protein [Vicinamibacterales bacterium]